MHHFIDITKVKIKGRRDIIIKDIVVDKNLPFVCTVVAQQYEKDPKEFDFILL